MYTAGTLNTIFGGLMKVTKKFVFAGLCAICVFVLALTFAVGLSVNINMTANADVAVEPTVSASFYDKLLDSNGNEYKLAKKFYDALTQINENGDFKKGVVDHDISEIVTSDQLKSWVEDGNIEVPKAFSAARDAFLTDHPEIFYINFYKMTISVARSNGNYVGYINSGREANLYYDNGLNTPEAVEEAILRFNEKVTEVVNYVNEQQAADTYSARDAFLAKAVNYYIATHTKYDYVAYENKDDPNYIAAAYINTPYGALVEGKAVCGGFSTAYKVIMDKLGIPCITVNGTTKSKDQNGNNTASSVYHMWNYVWLETPQAATQSDADGATGAWYSVDTTWNNSAKNKYRYALLNAANDEAIHIKDGVISSSGYELIYPEVSKLNYGSTSQTNGLQYSITYTPTDELDDYGNKLQETHITVSYNGKSAKRLLEEDGLYLVFRNADYRDMQITWTDWAALEIFRQFAVMGGILNEEDIQDDGNETRYYDNTSVYYTQFAVFDVKPDRAYPNGMGDNLPPPPEDYYYFYYSYELLNNTNAIEASNLLVNESYGTYTPAPYVQSSTPNTRNVLTISDSMRDPNITDKVMVAENKAYVFEVTYDEELHILNKNIPIGIQFISEHPNAKDYARFFPVNSNGDLVEIVQRPRNSGDPTLVANTLRFKFAPSLMYEHNEEGYNIVFSNVGSTKMIPVFGNGTSTPTEHKTSDKLPNPVYLHFGRLVVACPACFNYDGRLYVDCCAQPTLIANSDLSEMDFLDENNESTFSVNERSQMMLVAEKANTETVDAMLDGIHNNNDINLSKQDIKSSETYDIMLQMCNKYPKIPNGSYVKIALGFPEGYGPNDEGVTFKLFHRKQISADNYIIEEIPCVVTQFGIVATVTSFSPYMVAVVDSDKVTDKSIFASIEGNGRKLSKDDGKIVSLKQGESHTYTIDPDEGYKIYSVTLNGKDITKKVNEKGELTLGYNDIDTNNQLVIQYIADEAAARIQKKIDDNIISEVVAVEKYVINVPVGQSGNITAPQGLAPAIIAIIVVCTIVAVAAIVTVTIVLVRKKKTSPKRV